MGKYMKQYEDLLQRKSSMQKLHNRMLNQYGHLMSDNAKAFNMANWSISEQMYDRDIAIAQAKAMQELEDEAVERILKRVDVKIEDKATPVLQEFSKQLMNLGKR